MKIDKQFYYEVQPYQEDCIKNIISIFKQLHSNKKFSNVIEEHYKNSNYHFSISPTKNMDIMMGTGTGKTFTFIKTIFELSNHFNYKKFIILVPNVAIREGTKNNLEDTKDYFKSFYVNEKDKEIESFVYESGNISAVNQFINTSHLSVLVMTPSSFDSKDNILNRPLEKEMNAPELFVNNEVPPKSYLECLKRLNPIIIMDEPHRFEGNAFKTYFEGFKNYFLRFGATFPHKKESLSLSNVAYTLDSISSFRQNLVKKIIVYTKDLSTKVDTIMAIENSQVKVHTLINGNSIIRTLNKGDCFNGKSIIKINKDSIVLVDGSIERIDYSLSDDSLKNMIKETIGIHFKKEEKLFELGIKALTLFFMESNIDLFRGEEAKIKTFFEQIYQEERNKIISQLDKTSKYYKYLQNDFDNEGTLQVHKGYFSGDKKYPSKADQAAKIKADINEILKNSFLVATTFTEKDLKIALKEKNNFDDIMVRKLFKVLEDTNMIVFQETHDGLDCFKKSPEYSSILKEQNLPEEQIKALENLFTNDTNIYIQKAEHIKKKKKVFIKATHLQEFQTLWNTINQNSFYILDTLNKDQYNQLIQNIKQEIEKLNIEEILLQTIRSNMDINKIGEQDSITKELTATLSYKSKVDYLEFVRTLSIDTKTPISFLVEIFNSLSSHFKTKILCNNPKQALYEISEIIRKHLVEMIKINVTYSGINGTIRPDTCFGIENRKRYLDAGSTGKYQKEITDDFSLKTKWVFEEVIEYDSDFELEIIEQDPKIDTIEIFGKLPRLKIKTPLGEYNPDFCYAIKNNEGNKVFLIVEAKGYKTSTAIPTDQKAKIDFAKKYFEALNKYYENENVKIVFKERINQTQLATLIDSTE